MLQAAAAQSLRFAAQIRNVVYWVVDVRGQRMFAFSLQPEGKYKVCEQSQVLTGLPISLLEETIMRLSEGSNIRAAAWFNQQVSKLNL